MEGNFRAWHDRKSPPPETVIVIRHRGGRWGGVVSDINGVSVLQSV